MHFFRYAQDWYGEWLSVKLLAVAALLLVTLPFIFMGIHLLRRGAGGEPIGTEGGPEDDYDRPRLPRFEWTARLYHWGNFVFLFLLVLSGVAMFAPPALGAIHARWFSWLLIHEIFAVCFIVGLIVHIVIAPMHGRWRTMWYTSEDGHDIGLIVKNFFGFTRRYPRVGKYDPFQKIYHSSIAVISLVMIFTGVFLFVSAEVWATFSHEWMRWQRLLHDVGAFIFVAVILGHIFFGLIRVNWPYLVSMFTGSISTRFFNLYHSAKRWQPEEEGSGIRGQDRVP